MSDSLIAVFLEKGKKQKKDETVMGVEVRGLTPDEILAIPVNTRHPVIASVANEAVTEALKEPFPIPNELYVQVLESSIRDVEREMLIKNPQGPRSVMLLPSNVQELHRSALMFSSV